MGKLIDTFAPRGDTLQIRLKKKGTAVAGLYKDEKTEVRSPTLDEAPPDAAKTSDRR